MKHVRYIETNCDTGLQEIVGVMTDENNTVQLEWNGKEWEDAQFTISMSYLQTILNEDK